MQNPHRKRLKRQTESVILHFDYDCFYASVFENENPALRALPLAVQQKQIVVTCNYEARRRGLHKLQLIKDAKRICPDIVIVLGEDLARFRDASKELYLFLKSFSWSQKVERLGFDEVFMDVSDIIDYNVGLLNPNKLSSAFFCLSQDDPTAGFQFDASNVAGNTFPEESDNVPVTAAQQDTLRLRLNLASHLAQHIREALHSQKGYTCTVGVSTNKTLAKLVGNLHKPASQTTLLPPYEFGADEVDNVTAFVDGHEVGKIPGIGFKLAQKLRAYALQKPSLLDNDDEAIGGPKETVLARHVRKHPGMSGETLERILGGPGTPHGIGSKVWSLLNGCDDAEVGLARDLPRQISIENTYARLDSLQEVVNQLRILTTSLLKRMRADLVGVDEHGDEHSKTAANPSTTDNTKARWLAIPKTVRLSTRPRPPLNSTNGKSRWPTRISRSAPLPNFVLSQKESLHSLAEKLVMEVLVPLFRKLHPERNWNLGLLNIAVTNIVDAANEKGGVGRDIANMFRRQDDVLKQWRVEERHEEEDVDRQVVEDTRLLEENGGHGNEDPELALHQHIGRTGSEDVPTLSQEDHAGNDDRWESEDEDMMEDDLFRCEQCGATMPVFAMAAHGRWHNGLLDAQ